MAPGYLQHLFAFNLIGKHVFIDDFKAISTITFTYMFSEPYKAAVIQMNSQTDLQANLDSAYHYIKESVNNGAKVVGLPENFSFLGGLSMRMEKAATIAGEVPKFLAETAREFEVYLMGGSYPVPAGRDKVYNHSPFYTPDGSKVQHYNKIHLFDVDLDEDESYRESDYVKAGDPEAVVYESNQIGNWGLSVCYDLRFPELYRQQVDNSAEILSIPSAFTHTTGQDHWRPLLRARAIENTCYVFAPAQTGLHGANRKTWGHAMIIDPWGRVVADAGQEPGIAVAEINPHIIQQVRSRIPSLYHRRI
jgi:predicted amidohydrolase